MSYGTLFNKTLSVLRIHDDDKRKCELLFTIEEVLHNIKKEMVLKLTDENDPFFLYKLKITEEDFYALKEQQGLLVDFGMFPQKVVEMLNGCTEVNSKGISKFTIMFTITGHGSLSSVGQLAIVETNEFKHLNHLLLKFHPGTDGDIKNHLLDILKKTKNKLDQTKMASDKVEFDLSSQLQQCRETSTCKTAEADDLKKQMDDSRATHVRAIADLQHKHKMEIVEKEEILSSLSRSTDVLVADLNAQVQNFKANKSSLEKKIETLATQTSSLEAENRNLRAEVSKVRKESGALECKSMERESRMTDLTTRLAVADQRLADKEEVLTKITEQLKTEKQLTKKNEEELEKSKKDSKKLMEVVNKCKEKMKELAENNDKLSDKLKLRTHVSKEQEICLEKERAEVKKLEKEVEKLKKKLHQAEGQCEAQSEKLEQLEEENCGIREELKIKTQELEKNDGVITWLNKQSNENQIAQKKAFDLSQAFQQLSPNNNNNRLDQPASDSRLNNLATAVSEEIVDQKYLRSSQDKYTDPLQQMPSSRPSGGHAQRMSTKGTNPTSSTSTGSASIRNASTGVPFVSPGINSTFPRAQQRPVSTAHANRAPPPTRTPLLNAYFPSRPA